MAARREPSKPVLLPLPRSSAHNQFDDRTGEWNPRNPPLQISGFAGRSLGSRSRAARHRSDGVSCFRCPCPVTVVGFQNIAEVAGHIRPIRRQVRKLSGRFSGQSASGATDCPCCDRNAGI